MRRAAHVAGLMEIRGNGKCILELRQITPSTVSESSGAASSNEMPVPDSAKLFGDVQSGAVRVHSTKIGVTKKESSTTSTICSAMQEFFGEPTVRGIMHSNSDFTHGYLRKRRAQRPKPSRARPPRTRTRTITSELDKNPDIDDKQKGGDMDKDTADKKRNQKDVDMDSDIADNNHNGNQKNKGVGKDIADKSQEDKDMDSDIADKRQENKDV